MQVLDPKSDQWSAVKSQNIDSNELVIFVANEFVYIVKEEKTEQVGSPDDSKDSKDELIQNVPMSEGKDDETQVKDNQVPVI